MTGEGAEAGGERVTIAGERAGAAAIYAVELPTFEGPLDLLLHLVRRHELDILDIPIAFVAEKYLEYLSVMQALDLEIAGEYLVMAATLAYLKSRELLPQEAAAGEGEGQGDEDGEDPREALIRRLIEYERFRAASAELEAMPVAGRDVFGRGGEVDLPPLDPGMAPVTLFRLAEAYARVLQRAKIHKSHEVTIEAVTVRQRMEQLSLILDARQRVDFDSLFLERTWSSMEELRAMLVVTLMSVLEMVKLGLIGIHQADATETIRLERRASHAATVQALSGYDEEASYGGGPPRPPSAIAPAPAVVAPATDDGHVVGVAEDDGEEVEGGADRPPFAGAPRLIIPRSAAEEAAEDQAAEARRAAAQGGERAARSSAAEEDADVFTDATATATLRREESLSIPWTEAADLDDAGDDLDDADADAGAEGPARAPVGPSPTPREESLSIPWTEADPSEWVDEESAADPDPNDERDE